MPVHFAGCPAEMDEIRKTARAHRLALIEDAAHAIGAEYRGKKIGFMGKLKRPGTLTDIATLLKGTLRAECVIHGFGKNGDEKITSVGIVSGFGGDCVTEAGKEGLDLVVTGEFSHSDVHPAKEAGVSVIAAGHYVTETLGLQALRPVLEKRFKVSTVFIDEPTGM